MHEVHKLSEEGLLTPVQAGNLMHKFGEDLSVADHTYHHLMDKQIEAKTFRQIESEKSFRDSADKDVPAESGTASDDVKVDIVDPIAASGMLARGLARVNTKGSEKESPL